MKKWSDKILAKKAMVLIVGQKGGIGKSVLAVATIERGRELGHQVAAYDADAVVSSTFMTLALRSEDGKYLQDQDPLKGVFRYNVRDPDQADMLLNSVETGALTIVHDMPGGTITDIERLLFGSGIGGFDEFLDALETVGYALTLLHLVTPDPATITSVRGYLEAFSGRVRHVAIMNKAFESLDNGFEVWQRSKTRKLLETSGGREISLPALHPKLVSVVRDRRRPLLDPTLDVEFSFTERVRLDAFRKAVRSELAKIEDWLFP